LITVADDAPPSVHDLARKVDEALTAQARGPFVSLTTIYDATGDLPDPAKNNGKIILLSNGTFWLAQSIAGAWTYPDMTPV
jgi:hypothetical protein